MGFLQQRVGKVFTICENVCATYLLRSPIVCATTYVKSPILCATATAGIGTAANSTYPLMVGGNTRYQIGFCNSGATNAYYPWLVHDTNNLVVHFNGIGDRMCLNTSGDLCTTGCIKSPVGYFTSSATIKGSGNNSGKSDFTVHTGGTASMALSGAEFRVGATDVNWSVAVRSTGCFETYGQPLSLNVVEGNRNINFVPSGTGYVCTAAIFCSNNYIKSPIVCATGSMKALDYCALGGGWFRSMNSASGMYNNCRDAHFYAAGDNYWHINPKQNQTTGGLVFYQQYNASQGHATGRRGYVYFDSTNNFGLLNCAGAWAFKISGTADMCLVMKTFACHCICSPIVCATSHVVAPVFCGATCGGVNLGSYVGIVKWPHCNAQGGSRTFQLASNQGVWGNLVLAMSDANDGTTECIMMDVRNNLVTICKNLCANTLVRSPIVCGSSWVCSGGTICGATVCAPVVCATTCASGPLSCYTATVLNNRLGEVTIINKVFSNAVANLGFCILLGNNNVRGSLEVEATSDYSNLNATGVLRQVWSIGGNTGGGIWNNTVERIETDGPVAASITFGAFAWDSSNSRYYIPVYHISSTGNTFAFKLKLFSMTGAAKTFVENVSSTAVAAITIPTAYASRHRNYIRELVCSSDQFKSPIVCATSCVRSNVLYAYGDMCIYADAAHTMSLWTSGSDRWVEMCCYLRVKASAFACTCFQSPVVCATTKLKGSCLHVDGASLSQGGDATVYITASSSNDWGLLVDKPSYEYGIDSRVHSTAVYAYAGRFGGTIKFAVGNNCMCHATMALSPIVCGSSLVRGGIVCSTTYLNTNGLIYVTQAADNDGIRFRGVGSASGYYGRIGVSDVGYLRIFAEGNRSIDLKSGRQIRFYTSTDNSTYNNSVTFGSDGSSTFTGCVQSPIMRISGCLMFDSNYGIGAFGKYHASLFQHVWSMGEAYKMNAGGANLGGLYGLAWTHTNAGGQSKAGLSHQLLIVHAGNVCSAIGTGMWTSGVSCSTNCFMAPTVCATTVLKAGAFSCLSCACLVVGTGGIVPVIKAGGGNTDLRICSAGSGGWMDFHANGAMRLCISTAGVVYAPNCFQAPIVCATSCFLLTNTYLRNNCIYVAGNATIAGTIYTGGLLCGCVTAASCCVSSPVVCGTSCVKSPIICATTCFTGGVLRMGTASGSEGILLQGATSTTYPVFLRSLSAVAGGETSAWIFKEASAAWGIWHNNPINTIDFTRSPSTGIENDVGGGDNTVMIRLNMASGNVCAAGCVHTPIVCATTCVRTGVVCATGAISSDSTVCGTEICTDGWFRNASSGEGLYNTTDANHFYSVSANTWRLYTGSSNVSILTFYNCGANRGSIYANNSNQIGFTESNGQWAYQINVNGSHCWYTNATAIRMHLNTGACLNVCGKVLSPVIFGSSCVASPKGCFSTCVQSPIVCATNYMCAANLIRSNDWLCADRICSASCVKATNWVCVSAGHMCASGNVYAGLCHVAPIVCATNYVKATNALCTTGVARVGNLYIPNTNCTYTGDNAIKIFNPHGGYETTWVDSGNTGQAHLEWRAKTSAGSEFTWMRRDHTGVPKFCCGVYACSYLCTPYMCGGLTCGSTSVNTPMLCATSCILLTSGANVTKMCNSVGFTVVDSTEGLLVRDNSANVFEARASGNKSFVNLHVCGSLSKASGCFSISHPDPAKNATHNLQHAFVESPTEGDNIYRWQVQTTAGTNVITLPTYYRFLNKNDMVWVSPYRNFGSAYGEVTADQCCLIVCSNQDGCYNVLLIGTRKDEHAESMWTGAEVLKPEDDFTGVPTPVVTS